LHCRERSGNGRTSADENRTGSSSQFRSSIDVDVVYVDALTGNTVEDEIGEDASSVSRANSFRHRSLYVDPETDAFPAQLADPAADKGLPVASATFSRVCLFDRLADRLADILLRRRSFRVVTFVQCRRVDDCLRRIRRTLVDRKCIAESKLSGLHVRLSRLDDVDVVAEMAEAVSSSLQVTV